MRPYLILIVALLTAACDPPPHSLITVDTDSFVGHWYGVRPDGVTTFHSDSSFEADGTIVVRFFSCLSSSIESRWTDSGTWTWNDDLLTITLTSESDSDGSESYTHRYYLLEDDYDQRSFRSESGDYTFWLKRRWRDDPYDCTTTKAELDADRARAIEGGQFQALYPDYPGVSQ